MFNFNVPKYLVSDMAHSFFEYYADDFGLLALKWVDDAFYIVGFENFVVGEICKDLRVHELFAPSAKECGWTLNTDFMYFSIDKERINDKLVNGAIASFEIEGILISDEIKEVGKKIIAGEVDAEQYIDEYIWSIKSNSEN